MYLRSIFRFLKVPLLYDLYPTSPHRLVFSSFSKTPSKDLRKKNHDRSVSSLGPPPVLSLFAHFSFHVRMHLANVDSDTFVITSEIRAYLLINIYVHMYI